MQSEFLVYKLNKIWELRATCWLFPFGSSVCSNYQMSGSYLKSVTINKFPVLYSPDTTQFCFLKIYVDWLWFFSFMRRSCNCYRYVNPFSFFVANARIETSAHTYPDKNNCVYIRAKIYFSLRIAVSVQTYLDLKNCEVSGHALHGLMAIIQRLCGIHRSRLTVHSHLKSNI